MSICSLHSTGGLVGDTAFHTRIAECFIKHPEYFFGEAPVIKVPPKPVTFTANTSDKCPPSALDLNESENNDGEDVDFEASHRPLSINSEDSVNGE